MNYTPELNNLEKLIAVVKDELGLVDWNSYAAYSPSSNYPQISLRLETTINTLDLVKEKDIINKLFDPLKHSNFIKSQLSEKQGEIDNLKGQLAWLNKQVEELKQYETYYNLSYNLNHGSGRTNHGSF